jgi:Domain of unknown function (DUF4159)/Aerotolerance regulator N-terminal
VNFGPIFFAAPWALAVLAALPLLFLILRATPPAPKLEFFPPLQLLFGLRTEEESRKRAPWWLVLLRALAAALMIIAFARPSLTPQAAGAIASGPILLVVDDGWASAPSWANIRAAADDVINDAERNKQELFILLTAASRTPREAGEALSPVDARGLMARLEPKPWRVDRADAQARLPKKPERSSRIVWLTDGLDDPGAADFGGALMQRGSVIARLPPRLARAIVGVSATSEGIQAEIHRAPGGPGDGAIAAETLEGRSLGAGQFRFPPGSDIAEARVVLPPEIAARAARVRIVGEASAGATRLLAAGSGRPLVGLADSGGGDQPLLSDLYYVERAIAPFASARRGEIRALIDSGAQAIVLPDASRISPPEAKALDEWLRNKGGLLVRFAGPRLANAADDLTPVRLRPGARALGGAMAWEKPQNFAPFAPESPFSGLNAAPDVTINRQVLVEPAAEREARVWARLADGAPVVTAAARGKGLIVLYHITAGPTWSDLPLSGLYVDMLRRTLAFAGRVEGATSDKSASGPWIPRLLLDGYGALAPPGADAKPIPPDIFPDALAKPETPPGFYDRAGSPGAALDAASVKEALAPIALANGIERAGLEGSRTRLLGGPFLSLAAILIALDLILALALAGRLPRLPVRTASATAALLLAFYLAPPPAHAKPEDTLETHLAYIRTGDARRDSLTAAGLQALGETLTARTAVEPGAPIPIDPARDDLSPYPMIYWAAPDNPTRLSDAAVANLDRYMRLGGLIFLDTRDPGRTGSGGPAAVMLQGLDTPPLELIAPNSHVLSRTFYLLKAFPGRAGPARIWAETPNAAAARDGVASLMIGDGDWASQWAAAPDQNQNYGYGGGTPSPREMALRFGVNLVMMSLTGNYKTDQVHIPTLLNRLGRER